jgi:hypothetical protein
VLTPDVVAQQRQDLLQFFPLLPHPQIPELLVGTSQLGGLRGGAGRWHHRRHPNGDRGFAQGWVFSRGLQS